MLEQTSMVNRSVSHCFPTTHKRKILIRLTESCHTISRICIEYNQIGAQVWFKRGRWTIDDEASCVSATRRCAKIFYIASYTILSSKLFVVYLIFSLCFERQNGVTEGKDGV